MERRLRVVQVTMGKVNRTDISPEFIKDIFMLDHETGNIYWKCNMGRNKTAGKLAGKVDRDGYLATTVLKNRFYNHILVWALAFGCFPKHEIDHIDGNKTNNSPRNLRDVQRSCNMINRWNCAKNTSGVRGVRWVSRERKWAAVITKNKRHYFFGTHRCFLEAVSHRLAAEQCLYGQEYGIESPATIYMRSHLLSIANKNHQ